MPIEVLYDYILFFSAGGESFTVGKIMLAIIVPVSAADTFSENLFVYACHSNLLIHFCSQDVFPGNGFLGRDMFNHHFQF